MYRIFYHSADLDGWCSGAIIRFWLNSYELPFKMYPITYGDPFPWSEIDKNDHIIMADFSLPMPEMKTLSEACDNLTWIDHHARAIAEHDANPFPLIGLRDSTRAACELTWRYLMGADIPSWVRLLSLYDTWNHGDPDFDWDKVLNFQYGLSAYAQDPEKSMNTWADLCLQGKHDVGYHCRNGEVIRRYLEMRFDEIIATRSYTLSEWEGYRCLVLNDIGPIVNYMGDLIANGDKNPTYQGYDLVLAYGHVKGDKWRFELRTHRDDIDVSAIAKKHGGGGHRKAAGFMAANLGCIGGSTTTIKYTHNPLPDISDLEEF